MSDCLFCKIINKELASDIVFEDNEIIVIKDKFPKAPVHLLMLPKLHVESLNELTDVHSSLVGKMLVKVRDIAKNAGIGEGYKTQIHTGEKGGQEIFHLHFHIMGSPED